MAPAGDLSTRQEREDGERWVSDIEEVRTFTNITEGLAAAARLVALGNTERALEVWADLRCQFPRESRAFNRAGAVLICLRRFDAAETLLSEACKLFPDDPEVLIEFARTAQLRRDHDAASVRWGQVRDRFPGDVRGATWDFWRRCARQDNSMPLKLRRERRSSDSQTRLVCSSSMPG